MRRETVVGLSLLAASLSGVECGGDNGVSQAHVEMVPMTVTQPIIVHATPTELPTFTPTPEIKKDLPAYFSPTKITVESVPSLSKGLPVNEAQQDADGNWSDPGLTQLFKSERFPNQTVIWGHSRWQGVYQPSGHFMMDANVGDVVSFDGVTDTERFMADTTTDKKVVKNVRYQIKEFQVLDSRDINKFYFEDEKFPENTIIFFTSLRVAEWYDPSRYWVIPPERFLGKATQVRDLQDPSLYGYAVAILQPEDKTQECKVVRSYGDEFKVSGFKTPIEQCP